MTDTEYRTTKQQRSWFQVLLVPVLATVIVLPAYAESLQEIAARTHFHGVSFNRAGGDAELLIATHHGIVAVRRDGSATQISTTQDFMGFSADPSDPLRYFGSGHPAGGGNSGFLESRDGGVTWSRLSDGVGGPVDFHNLAVSPSNPKVIYGFFGGIQMSRDGGSTWQITGEGPEGLVQLAVSSKDSRKILAATKNGLQVSGDSGGTWSNSAFEGEIVSAIRVESDGTTYAFVLGHGLLRGAESKAADWESLSNSFGQEIPLHISSDPKASNHLVLSTQTSELLESLDGGKTWTSFGLSQ
ncbi:MAG: hypothetical protein KDK89_05030 [Alphaproteobacteria bacterium]|nr:hypothetical protein [Alphaproteobacteria bacterium]